MDYSGVIYRNKQIRFDAIDDGRMHDWSHPHSAAAAGGNLESVPSKRRSISNKKQKESIIFLVDCHKSRVIKVAWAAFELHQIESKCRKCALQESRSLVCINRVLYTEYTDSTVYELGHVVYTHYIQLNRQCALQKLVISEYTVNLIE